MRREEMSGTKSHFRVINPNRRPGDWYSATSVMSWCVCVDDVVQPRCAHLHGVSDRVSHEVPRVSGSRSRRPGGAVVRRRSPAPCQGHGRRRRRRRRAVPLPGRLHARPVHRRTAHAHSLDGLGSRALGIQHQSPN